MEVVQAKQRDLVRAANRARREAVAMAARQAARAAKTPVPGGAGSRRPRFDSTDSVASTASDAPFATPPSPGLSTQRQHLLVRMLSGSNMRSPLLAAQSRLAGGPSGDGDGGGVGATRKPRGRRHSMVSWTTLKAPTKLANAAAVAAAAASGAAAGKAGGASATISEEMSFVAGLTMVGMQALERAQAKEAAAAASASKPKSSRSGRRRATISSITSADLAKVYTSARGSAGLGVSETAKAAAELALADPSASATKKTDRVAQLASPRASAGPSHLRIRIPTSPQSSPTRGGAGGGSRRGSAGSVFSVDSTGIPAGNMSATPDLPPHWAIVQASVNSARDAVAKALRGPGVDLKDKKGKVSKGGKHQDKSSVYSGASSGDELSASADTTATTTAAKMGPLEEARKFMQLCAEAERRVEASEGAQRLAKAADKEEELRTMVTAATNLLSTMQAKLGYMKRLANSVSQPTLQAVAMAHVDKLARAVAHASARSPIEAVAEATEMRQHGSKFVQALGSLIEEYAGAVRACRPLLRRAQKTVGVVTAVADNPGRGRHVAQVEGVAASAQQEFKHVQADMNGYLRRVRSVVGGDWEASRGIEHQHKLVLRVAADAVAQCQQAQAAMEAARLASESATATAQALRDVVLRGTGGQSQRDLKLGAPITGVTNDVDDGSDDDAAEGGAGAGAGAGAGGKAKNAKNAKNAKAKGAAAAQRKQRKLLKSVGLVQLELLQQRRKEATEAWRKERVACEAFVQAVRGAAQPVRAAEKTVTVLEGQLPERVICARKIWNTWRRYAKKRNMLKVNRTQTSKEVVRNATELLSSLQVRGINTKRCCLVLAWA